MVDVLRGRVVVPGGVLEEGIVAFGDEGIIWVGPVGDLPDDARWPVAQRIGTTLLPGLVDLHCHGAAGHSFPDGDATDSRAAASHHLAQGTTGLLASLVTADEAGLVRALGACADLADDGTLLGIHLEGPFIAPTRCGAQDPTFMRVPDLDLLDRLLDAGRGHVRTMTYAAELPGADGLVDRLNTRGVVASLGHTDADAATAASSLARAGRASVTHLFNAMRPLHHRDPGAVVACLTAAARGDAVVELVADGVHLADETVAMVFDLVGAASVALVTDAMAAAGMPDGRYRLGSASVDVTGGVAMLPGSGALAGGTSSLVDVVRRCVGAGVALDAAVEAASATPARLLGLDGERGTLAAGLRADVLATDDDLVPAAVWNAGSRVAG
ncbi:MAG TPA: N-acetylglucosamine-6-phosphate deacetylase [Actinomycetales bacterium]|nr:N-acetylglucosamine-6-phosphate deacetylase [Actinomycetales bacterium]